MASLRDLKRQIGSVKNIAKVTEALQTVSAVKFRKAEARVKKARPYADNVEQMMRDVARSASGDSPLLAGREVRRIVVATLTADRGLAGGFNAQVLRRTAQFRAEKGREAELGQVASGRKSVAFFRFRNVELDHVYTGYTDSPTYEQAREIGRALTGLFEDEKADEIYLIYNRFESALSQRPVLKRLIPVAEEEENGEDEERDDNLAYMEYVPDPETVLKKLVPRYVETMVWQALLEGAAGEHGARMTAMKNATDNANDLAKSLTLQMNKARQAQITGEIIEIAAGADALAAG
ncbi:ATP synthase F1 subunit gamma [Rubrobacter tropicus]|uniref:ATP synthase gamma chain n=1 Tax=Rubrobacter tropicus TaxID=2653851 RepID=A0A6G8QA70_9ACTN|nr:ATP synthase F1 subunit gamma [Rubrobacter tropicus]QIN83207.1 ATP synthase F1 subunit gamma [Rubrobacter tropicus]